MRWALFLQPWHAALRVSRVLCRQRKPGWAQQTLGVQEELRVQEHQKARVHRTEYWRREKKFKIRTLEVPFEYSALYCSVYMYKETTQGQAKNYQKGLGGKVPRAHTELRIVSLSTSHTRKCHDSWCKHWSGPI